MKLILLDTLEPVWLKMYNSWTACIGHPMVIHDGIFSLQWRITTATVYIFKKREEKVIITVDFSSNFTMPCMPIGDAKTCAAHYVAQLSLPKSFQPHTMY